MKKSLVFLIGFVMAFTLYNCQEQEQSVNINGEYSLSGRITYPDMLTGISKALITISNDDVKKEDISDATGNYQITGLPSGNYEIKVVYDPNSYDKNDFSIWKQTLNIGQDDRNYSIVLARKRLRVVDSENFCSKYDNPYIGSNTSAIKVIEGDFTGISFYDDIESWEVYKVPENVNWSSTNAYSEIRNGNWHLIHSEERNLAIYLPYKAISWDECPNGIAYGARLKDGDIILLEKFEKIVIGYNI